MSKKEDEFWNAEQIYDREIYPLMNKILEICIKNNIPVAATFQFENDPENGPGCCTSLVPGTRVHSEVLKKMHAIKPEMGTIRNRMLIKGVDGKTRITSAAGEESR